MIIFDVDGVLLDQPTMRAQITHEKFNHVLKGIEKLPAVFKVQYPEIYKDVNYSLYRYPETPAYPKAINLLKKLMIKKQDFILLSERRSKEEELAERACLQNMGVTNLIGSKCIKIVRQTTDKIPIIQGFTKREKTIIIDDGLDKLEKFITVGIKADFIWFNEFDWQPAHNIPDKIQVVKTHQKIESILFSQQ